MTELYPWWVYLHVLGAFVFAFGHGASALAALRIRGTADRDQIRLLLDLSQLAVGAMYIGLLLLLVGGIAAGLVGGHFSRGWIWLSIGLLVLTMVAMYAMATPFYGRFREAVGARTREPADGTTPRAASDADVQALASSSRPIALFAIGVVGFVVILWLMLFKPF